MPVFSSCTIKLEGWDAFETAVNPRKFFPLLAKQVNIASRVLLEQFKKQVADDIKNSGLWKKNSEWTLRDKAKRGTGGDPLLDSRNMLNSIGGQVIRQQKLTGGGAVLGGFSVGISKNKASNRVSQFSKNGRRKFGGQTYNIPYILHEGAILKNPRSGKTMVLPPRPFLKHSMQSKEFTSQVNASLRIALKIAFYKYTAKYG